jgi:monovalent cation:H+ antiporter, CPA1 family
MTSFQLAALFLALVGAAGWLNARTLHWPSATVMVIAGAANAGVLLAIERLWPTSGAGPLIQSLERLDFPRAVMGYMLAFLLFAGAMQVDLSELRRRRLSIWTLATLGVLASTAIVGVGLWLAARALGLQLDLAWACVFGALISPTDPIAVLAAVREGKLSKVLEVVLQGEALFNDGVGLVAFSTLVAFAMSGSAPHPFRAAGEIVLEAGGGLLLGTVVAAVTGRLLRAIDDYVVETTGTIALAVGVFVLAGLIHVSAPIAAAAAGLFVGQRGLKGAMSQQTRRYVEGFWELVDQILNALLFLLLGLQVFVLPFSLGEIGLWVAAIVLTVAARLLVVFPLGAFFHFRDEEPGASVLLTWGGLRGAISLALALSLPRTPYRDLLLTVTFIVVAFSVVVQGLTFSPLARRLTKRIPADKATSTRQD